jgi:ribosome-associated translation inhibitor RaiA
MQLPLQMTFRHMAASPALEARIRQRADELEHLCARITSCRVVVECRHKHKQQGKLFEVRVDMTLPGAELVAGRDHGLNHAHEDAYVAVRDAFDAARRQLEDYAREHTAAGADRATVRQIVPAEPAGAAGEDEDR